MIFGYYGNFSKFWSTEGYIADALERAGHTVMRIDRNDTTLVDCDYVLFAKLYREDIILKAKEQGIPTICWVFDLYRGYRSSNVPHFKADIVITTDGGDGYHTIRQGVHKPEKIMIRGKKIHDVVFVGMLRKHKVRREMVIRSRAKVVRNTRGLDLNKLLGQTKIALGDSYPASNYWSNRVYEMTGRGGFLIHPKVEGLPNYIPQFEYGKEREMIKYYLKHDKLREKLRKVQFENCPTYDDRVQELFELLV